MCLSHPKFVLNGHAQNLGSRHGLQCVSVEGVRTQKVPQKREFFIFAGVLPRQHLRNTEETLEVLSGSLSCSHKSREVIVLVERTVSKKRGKKVESKITRIQHPFPSPTSNIMLFDAKSLDNMNTLSACVKFWREFFT